MTTVSAKLFKTWVWRLWANQRSLAPADKTIFTPRYYRDGWTLFHMITGSILAKRTAEGLDALVMDVKVGSGAFVPTYELSEALAEAIVGVANGAGVHLLRRC